MLKIGLLIMLTMFGTIDYAQDGYFVLIQSENHQPFYVRLGDRLFSSSADGHLILSSLKDSTYSLTIGFPGQLSPDQEFSWTVQQDQELQLKSLGDKGWGLLNPRTNDLKMPETRQQAMAGLQPKGIKKDDAFSRLMADVVADTAVMYNTYAMASLLDSAHVADSLFASRKPMARPDPPVFQAPGQPVMHPGLVSVVRPPVVQIEGPVQGASTNKRTAESGKTTSESPKITGESPRATAEGAKTTAEGAKTAAESPNTTAEGSKTTAEAVKTTDPLKASDSSKRVDPADPVQNRSRPETSPRAEKVAKLSEHKTSKGLRLVYTLKVEGQKADTVVVFIAPDSTLGEKPAGDLGITEIKVKADTAQVASQAKTIPFINSDCHNFATDYDVDKLRVKMLQLTGDDDRIQAARKVFHTKCFSTKQIKALAEVFTSDESKYRFLEAAYPFASDGEFKDLSELLSDPVYNKKFKVMTGQR